MKNEAGILAIDLGTSGAKVGLVTLTGDCLGWEMEKVPLILVGAGGAEQDPNLWWQAINIACQRLLAQDLIARDRILAVCTSSMGEETVPVDREGNVMMNAMNWMDQRGAGAVQEKLKGWINPLGLGFGVTNILKWLRITGGIPSASGKDPCGHIAYIQKAHPQVYDNTHKFLNSLDFINLRLTGEFVATPDSILTLWATDNRDLGNIHYHPGLLKTLGIDREKLPDLVPATQVLGPLLPSVAQAWGLSKDVKVVAGSVDTQAAAIGGGAVEDFAPCLTLGTSSYITAHVPNKKTDILNNMASFPSAVKNRYMLMNNQTMAGGNLSFFAENIIYHKDQLLQEEKRPDCYKVFDKIVEKVPPGSNGILYTPWIFGERSPVDDHFIRGGIQNISLHNNREDIVRAVFEGVALNTRWLLGGVQKFLKNPCKNLRITGGGASSDAWCQIFADITGSQILQTRDPIQANARGAAFIGAVGLGELGFGQIPELVKIKEIYDPNPSLRLLYEEKFEAFKQFYNQTKKIYKRLNSHS